MRSLCDALYRLNIEFDMVSSRERNFSSYECLIVPALYSAPEDLLYALESYVKDGGHLITTYRSAFSDEHLKIYSDVQPHILKDCLGIHYDQYTYPGNTSVKLQADPSVTSDAKEWMDLLFCDTAKTIASYAHPVYGAYAAVTQNTFGKGSSLYFGTMLDDKMTEQILHDYLQEIHLSDADFSKYALHFPIITKQGENDEGHHLFYYFNYSMEEQKIPLPARSRKGTSLRYRNFHRQCSHTRPMGCCDHRNLLILSFAPEFQKSTELLQQTPEFQESVVLPGYLPRQ